MAVPGATRRCFDKHDTELITLEVIPPLQMEPAEEKELMVG